MNTIIATIEHEDHTYTATVTGEHVSIDVDGAWAGTGRWAHGRLTDCAANLGHDAYEAIGSEIDRAMRAARFA